MNCCYVGIDTGKDGAIAFLGAAVQVFDTPTVNVGKGSKRSYHEHRMAEILEEGRARCSVNNGKMLIAIEQVHSMPGQGVASMFSQGEGFGLWKGIVTALRIPWQLVTPQRWKRALMDGQPKEKAASVVVASRLFPKIAGELRGPRGAALDGRADALLIAEWLRREDNRAYDNRVIVDDEDVPF